MSNSLYIKSQPDLLTLEGVGEGNQKSWKTLRVVKLGRNLVGRISKCRRNVIDLTVLDPISLGELGVGFCVLVSLMLLGVLGR